MASFTEKQKEMKEKLAKEAIYEAALQVISKTGNETFRIQDIADAAGIATGTLYNYFQNKESLVYYVDRRLHKVFLKNVQSFSKQSTPAPQKLIELFERMFQFCEEYHVFFDLARKFTVVDQACREEKNEMMSLMVIYIKSVIDEGIAQGTFKRVDTNAAAKMFLFAMVGIMHTQSDIDDFDFSENRNLFLKGCHDYLAIQNS